MPAAVESEDGFVIIHTAAVAGRPRGALLSHGNVLFADLHFGYHMGLTPEDVHLNLLPLFHVGGLFLATSTFHAGGVNLNISKFDGSVAANLIQESGVSLFFDFPPILDTILKAAQGREHVISVPCARLSDWEPLKRFSSFRLKLLVTIMSCTVRPRHPVWPALANTMIVQGRPAR